jgi:acetyl-CoA carboxylase biotin carboxylase subunit
MYEDAIKLIKHIGYFGAATVEFLVDKDMNYYFMEVNPRVQVEHPVTEQITGVDIVKQQLLIAAGEKMTVKESIKTPKGHAIECRINAEDVSSNFMCSTGKIKECRFPRGGGIRVESHICEGFTVTPFYDSMLAKIITYADTREAAIKKMLIALDETYIEGVKTNIELQKTLLMTDEFNSGKFNTHFATDFIEKNYGK